VVYTLETVDLDDTHAAAAAEARRASGERKLANCWASLEVKKNDAWKGKRSTAYSKPGATHLSHAERNVVLKYLDKKGATINDAQVDGFQAGKKLKAAGVQAIIVFTELPPCPSCRTWYNQIVAGGVPVQVKIIAELEDYFKKIPYQRTKMFKEWIEDNFA